MDTTITSTIAQAIAPHAISSLRPRALAPWNTFAYTTAGDATACNATEAGVRVTGMRDSVALQGPPRGIPR